MPRRKTSTKRALIATSKDDAAEYLDTHPHLEPDSVVVLLPGTKSIPSGTSISALDITPASRTLPERPALARLARAAAPSNVPAPRRRNTPAPVDEVEDDEVDEDE